jgi:hypothetical protein
MQNIWLHVTALATRLRGKGILPKPVLCNRQAPSPASQLSSREMATRAMKVHISTMRSSRCCDVYAPNHREPFFSKGPTWLLPYP